MQFTDGVLNSKPIARLALGCMRFPDREGAAEVIIECVKNDVLYLDTSPGYSNHSEEENCETWVGAAIKGIREKVILSAKCSTGNGGTGLGEYNPAHGFSIRTADQVRAEIEQSLRRLDVDYLDCYQLWAVHSMEIYHETFKKGGWFEGILKAKDEGIIKHIGITGHVNNDEFTQIINSGYWEMVTIPFHMLDISRMGALELAVKKGINVFAMNPLAGGLLGTLSGELVEDFKKQYNLSSLIEMGLMYVAAQGASALSGISSKEQAIQNCEIMSKPVYSKEKADAMRVDFLKLLNYEEFSCTGCGYCMPCPQNILIPDILRNRNLYKVLGSEHAKQNLINMPKYDDGFKYQNCTGCLECESKCPNSVKVTSLFEEIKGYM